AQPDRDGERRLEPHGRLAGDREGAGALLDEADLGGEADGVATGQVPGLASAGVDVVPRLAVGVGAVDPGPGEMAPGAGGPGQRGEADQHRSQADDEEYDAGHSDHGRWLAG